MSAAPLLERLPNVREVAPSRWRSGCPVCGGSNNQKVAIREQSDGTVLLWCFAGCGAADIVSAVGMELRDLFPADHHAPTQSRRSARPAHWHAQRQAVQTLKLECLVAAIAAEDVGAGRPLNANDAARLLEAAIRIRRAIEACT